MAKLEKIEQEIAGLSSQDLARFRAWYTEFDSDAWDRQLEQDAAAGKLDALAARALEAHLAGKTSAL
jgi:hypothetical protein